MLATKIDYMTLFVTSYLYRREMEVFAIESKQSK
jgi:hypothetical protein